MRFQTKKNSREVSKKPDPWNSTTGAAPLHGDHFDEVFQSSYQGIDDDQRVRRRQPGRFNPVTGTYVARDSEPKRNIKLWPWIVLAFAAVALISTALNRTDPQNIAASASPDNITAMTVTGSQTVDTGQATTPTKSPANHTVVTREPVITPSPSPVSPVTPTPTPFTTPDPNSSVLKYGSKGDGVKTMQGQLIQLGYLPTNSDDGRFGDGTKTAVQSFQKVNSLLADGIAGEKTLALLNSGQAKQDPDPFVWVVSKEKVYHTDSDCDGMKDAKQIKKSEAEKRKLKPCEKCK